MGQLVCEVCGQPLKGVTGKEWTIRQIGAGLMAYHVKCFEGLYSWRIEYDYNCDGMSTAEGVSDTLETAIGKVEQALDASWEHVHAKAYIQHGGRYVATIEEGYGRERQITRR